MHKWIFGGEGGVGVYFTWAEEIGYLDRFRFVILVHEKYLKEQIFRLLAIGNISLFHYCQFGTENQSLVQKINTSLAKHRLELLQLRCVQVQDAEFVHLDVSLSPCGILVEET